MVGMSGKILHHANTLFKTSHIYLAATLVKSGHCRPGVRFMLDQHMDAEQSRHFAETIFCIFLHMLLDFVPGRLLQLHPRCFNRVLLPQQMPVQLHKRYIISGNAI